MAAKKKTTEPTDTTTEAAPEPPKPKPWTTVAERFTPVDLYDRWNVTIALREKLRGGKPKNDDLLADHIRRTTGHDDILTQKQIEEAQSKLPELDGLKDIEEEKVEKSSTGFLSDERGLYINTYQVKAMFRQSASMLGVYVKKRGSKQVCAEGAEIKGVEHESRIYLGKTEPDGTDESVVHAMTPKGKISGIKRSDYVEGVTLRFQVWVLKTAPQESRHIGEEDIVRILTFAQENGVGADRSQGFGKFNVVAFEKVA